MKVLMVEPDKIAYEAEIGERLDDLQKAVGGNIEVVYPYDDLVGLVCNEEGKIEGLPLNRALKDNTGKVYDIIAGTFFVCGLSEDNFASLSFELMTKYKKKFLYPQIFMKCGSEIFAIEDRPSLAELMSRAKEKADNPKIHCDPNRKGMGQDLGRQ